MTTPQQDRAGAPDEQLVEARRNARYTYAERRIQKIVDGEPPLTPEQLGRLAMLLRPVIEAPE